MFSLLVEQTSCILKNFFGLAQVQIPKRKFRRGLYTDSTLARFTLKIEGGGVVLGVPLKPNKYEHEKVGVGR